MMEASCETKDISCTSRKYMHQHVTHMKNFSKLSVTTQRASEDFNVKVGKKQEVRKNALVVLD